MRDSRNCATIFQTEIVTDHTIRDHCPLDRGFGENNVRVAENSVEKSISTQSARIFKR